ncbi:Fpg/Nei family DNA glycosylase [Brachybacterium sp. JHP9]|uniref:DNA-(apurinic or apyrimidinic site) lyase n=1 Tax=Brachybacterium equifaecis TaxID=2910770 RepID=A0ABT0QZ31_9MICO|nr:zinc finger domain-containing protein [Brachybacterium equifaecis]MCL6421960.1 Fpg/Nei family DNA glycosylase [Brachybacterium equifaecis]
MPEGHTIHRLAGALDAGFGGQRVRVSSPQGRFEEAAQLERWVLARTEAAGKHLLITFTPDAQSDPEGPAARIVHVHLGLYGSWTFAGDPGFALAGAIGAPRLRVGEREEALAGSTRAVESSAGADGSADEDGAEPGWRAILPRPTTRLRLQGVSGLADLTGPTACELYDSSQRDALLQRLGPDPLRADADPQRFVDRVLGSRTTIGALLMNQEVIAGVGNIYRAEVLFRARLDPFVPGRELSAGIVRGIWDDLVPLLRYGARTGRIVTTQPEHRDIEARIVERSRGTLQNGEEHPDAVARERSFYVYHRQTLPCRICGTEIRSRDLAARTVFWCPRCQSVRSRRSPWTAQHPAGPWADPAGQAGDPGGRSDTGDAGPASAAAPAQIA